LFVPPLLEVAIGAVETAGPLFFVEKDLVSLVQEEAAQQHYAEELGHLVEEFGVAVATRGH